MTEVSWERMVEEDEIRLELGSGGGRRVTFETEEG